MNSLKRQRGITLVVITLAMLALLAMVGLALDIARLVGDKARLQSVVDASALAAAKVLDTTGSQVQATDVANQTFARNASQQRDLAGGAGVLAVEFSNTVAPFVAGSNPPLFARVSATGFNISATFSAVLGFDLFNLSASAVAGPSPTLSNACNLAPMMVCGT